MADEDSIIRKSDSMGHARKVLTEHSVNMPHGWEIAMGMLLEGYDYLEVCGFGHNAEFRLCRE